LTTLAGSIELIQARRDDLPDRAREAVDLLSSDVARFRTLVEDLLEISRFDAGAVTLHTDELLLTQFVSHAVSVSSMPDTPVIIGDRADNMLIVADRRRLARVIANLIDNARLHGGGAAEVRVEIPAAGRQVAHIRVEDHGPGVPHHERRLVFERFARGGGAGRRAGNDGSGLGLALVAEHVRLHGGRVWVAVRADRTDGAAFIVELPAEDISADLDGEDPA
jgi:signal transduction histidine kinase